VFQALQQFLLWAMPVAALLAGLLTYMSILASLRTMSYLRGLYESYAKEERRDDASSKLYPDIHGPVHARRWASSLRSRCRWSLSSHGSPSLCGWSLLRGHRPATGVAMEEAL
jgi:hypothetical protein